MIRYHLTLTMFLFLGLNAASCVKESQRESQSMGLPQRISSKGVSFQCDGRQGSFHHRTVIHRMRGPTPTFLIQESKVDESKVKPRVWHSKILTDELNGRYQQLSYQYEQKYSDSYCQSIPKAKNLEELFQETTLLIPKDSAPKIGSASFTPDGTQYLRFHLKKAELGVGEVVVYGFIEDSEVTWNGKKRILSNEIDINRDMTLLKMLLLDTPIYGEKVASGRDKSSLDAMGITPQRHFGWVTKISFLCSENDHFIFQKALKRMIAITITTSDR